MHPVITMTCLENKTAMAPGSDFQEKLYTVEMALLFKKAGKAPAIRGQLHLESDNPLPYHPGQKYSIRLAEDTGLVLADKIPSGAEVPGGKG